MSGGAHVVQRTLDAALRVEHERRADDPGDGPPVHLLAEGPVGGEHRPVGVGEQGEGQSPGVAEGRELGGLVRRDADDREPRTVELGEVVPEVARLLRAARRRRRRVAVDHQRAAAEVGQRDGVAVGIGQGEPGRGIAGGQAHVLGHGRRGYRLARSPVLLAPDIGR